jgi:glucan-binding YG repeat protein
MVTDSLIEDTKESKTRYYYVDQYGAMVTNTWKAVAMDSDYNTDIDAEYWWYYFGSDGKAYTTDADKDLTKTRIKDINGLKYAFDEEGHMLYGWIDKTTKDQQDDNKQAWMTSQYYFNGWNDGHMATGWQKLTVENSDGDEKNYWFYFGNDGVKVADKTKKIDGKKYHFKADGNMADDWVSGTNSGLSSAPTSSVYYLNGDGSERKNKWVWAVPDEDWHKAEYDDDAYHWFYFGKDGKMANTEVKKVNGKKYAFNEYGEMMKGFVFVDSNNKVKGKTDDADKLKRVDFFNAALAGTDDLYYFSNDDEKDGAMKKGYQKIELDDGTYQFYFDAKDGKASNGYVSKIKKFVANGLVMQPTSDDDSNYMGVAFGPNMKDTAKDDYKNVKGAVTGVAFGTQITNDDYYLVSKNGSIVTNKTKLKDSEDNYYVVDPAGVVKIVFSSEDDYNKEFKIQSADGKSSRTATLRYNGMTLEAVKPDGWTWVNGTPSIAVTPVAK